MSTEQRSAIFCPLTFNEIFANLMTRMQELFVHSAVPWRFAKSRSGFSICFLNVTASQVLNEWLTCNFMSLLSRRLRLEHSSSHATFRPYSTIIDCAVK